jgi:ubiquinone/menaquinone biosynthesis C-methylase UbiE
LQLRPFPFLGALGLSVVAWTAGALVLAVSTVAVGAPLDIGGSASAFCIATPLGALSLLPGGVGVTGSLMIPQLQTLGASLAEASLAVILTRLFTFWFAFALGSVVLAWTLRHSPEISELEQHEHFDELAGAYSGVIPAHMRAHFLGKKMRAMHPRVPKGSKGLDLGCGHGWYLTEMEGRGHDMIGMDLSINQLANAREYCSPSARFLQGNVLAIPLADRSVEFAYCVNAMHHIEDAGDQNQAIEEMLRVLVPGGMLFIHEINVTNPLFRFYMGYVFPLMARIELGTERYLTPRILPRPLGARVDEVVYFTFLPDFLPQFVLRLFASLEDRLERSPLRHWSAHFMAVYRKDP